MKYYKIAVISLLLTLFIAVSSKLIGADAELFLIIELGSLIAGALGVIMLLLVVETRFNFLFVSAIVILLGGSMGILNTFFSTYWSDRDLWLYILNENNTTYEDLADARIYTNSFCLMFFILGYILQSSDMITSIHKKCVTVLHESGGSIKIATGILLLIQIYLVYGGHIVYGGTDFDLEGKPSHPLTAFIPLVPTIIILVSYNIRLENNNTFITKLILTSILLFEGYWFFLFGRRSIVFYFLLVMVGFFYNEPITFERVKSNAVIILICLVIIYQMTNLFQKIRVFSGYNVVQKVGVIETLKLMQVDESEYKSINKQNITLRSSYGSFILSFFVDLYKTKPVQPLNGQIIINSLLAATPSNYIIDKSTFLVQENLYNYHFGLSLPDCSESSVLESYLDFSTWGFIVYPILFFALIYLISKITLYQSNEINLITACCLFLIAVSMIETNMIIILNSIRSIIFFSFFVKLLTILKSSSVSKNVSCDE